MTDPKAPYEIIWVKGIEMAKSYGWDFTAKCMHHALRGDGDSKTYYNNSSVSNLVKSSEQYKDKVNDFISTYKRTGEKHFRDTIEFETPTDLYAALQHVTIKANVESNGNMLVKITDIYNFDQIRTTTDNISTFNAANDFGYMAQKLRILTPFHITIYAYEWAGK